VKYFDRANTGLGHLALALAALLVGSVAARASQPEAGLFPIALSNDLLLEFRQPKAGQGDAAVEWSQRQLKQMVRIPGMKAGQFLVATAGSAVSKPAFQHLSMYELSADSAANLEAELAKRVQDGRLQKGDDLFEPTGFRNLFRPLWTEVMARDIPGANPEALGAGPLSVDYLFVLSDPATPEQEDEYNSWYDLQHVPDVLRVPGFYSAQRYVRVAGSSKTPRYMVIFKFRTRDNEATNAEVRRRIQEKITRMSPAFGMTPGAMSLGGSYVPTGPRVSSSGSR